MPSRYEYRARRSSHFLITPVPYKGGLRVNHRFLTTEITRDLWWIKRREDRVFSPVCLFSLVSIIQLNSPHSITHYPGDEGGGGVQNGPLVAAVPYATSYPIKIINHLWQTKTDRLFTAPTCVFWVVRSLAIRAHVSSPLWVIQQPAGPSPPPLMFVHKPSGVLLEWPDHFHIRLEHLDVLFKDTVNLHYPSDFTYRKQTLLLAGC